MTKAAFVTLGCKVNQYESQSMQSTLRRNGYTLVGEESPADVYIINTCTVTNFSDRKARQLVRKTTRANPDARVIVTGCYAESAKEVIEEIPEVSLVFGNKEKTNILDYLEDLDLPAPAPASAPQSSCDTLESEAPLAPPPGQRTRALLKVQDGCSAFCSFCIIPYVRGKMTSRPLPEIVEEARLFATEGFQEVVLTGIHLGSYGLDVRRTVSLGDILEQISPIEGIKRIRIGSLEPMDFSNEMVDALAAHPKLMPHFHLPLQAGHDRTLERMRRRYTTAQYAELVAHIRRCFHNATVTSDIMVGFPGETDQEFNHSLNFVEQVGFSQLHVFRYSPRDGTPAATYPDQIQGDVAAARSAAMMKVGQKTGAAFREKMLGQTCHVLVERSEERPGVFSGYTENYLRTLVEVPERFVGQIVPVKLSGVDGDFMTSEVLGSSHQTGALKHLRLLS
jgi:threonylcarbamoyladenosine tRNA methylthiotransferase MtaB